MSTRKKLDPAQLHSPEDLLINATHLLNSKDSKAMRAVVLESMAALEVLVYNKIFNMLKNNLDPLYVKWLKDKTQMDFHSRLGVLTPIALNEDLADFKESDLWRHYKEARNTRNEMIHRGKIISYQEAEKVYNTIYDWLVYLESSAALEIELLKLKNHLESIKFDLNDFLLGEQILQMVRGFFTHSDVANMDWEYATEHQIHLDYVLKFGDINVVGVVKVFLGKDIEVNEIVYTYLEFARGFIEQINEKEELALIKKVILILLFNGDIPMIFQKIRKYDNNKIILMVVQL